MYSSLPHSRACGWKPHEHGPACHSNCPTCAGGIAPPLIDEKALPEFLIVPLVMYVDGERKIIGEATVRGSEVTAMVDKPVSIEVIDSLVGGTAEFSLGPFLAPTQERRNDAQH